MHVGSTKLLTLCYPTRDNSKNYEDSKLTFEINPSFTIEVLNFLYNSYKDSTSLIVTAQELSFKSVDVVHVQVQLVVETH